MVSTTPAKSTKEQTTGIDKAARLAKLQAAAEFMNQDTFAGTINKFPMALLLNDAIHPGLFIETSDAKAAGFGDDIGNGEIITHQFSGNEPEKKQGIFYTSPYLSIIAQSPRFIVISKDGVNPKNGKEIHPYGKAGTIVGIYADENGVINPKGSELYDQLKEEEIARLQTIYLLYVLGSDYKPLHRIPLAMPIKSTAAAAFGKALEEMKTLYFAEVGAINPEATPINNEGRSLLVFKPTFVMEMRGEPSKSPVCIPASFDWDFIGTPEEAAVINKQYTAIRNANNNFAYKYYEQKSEFHTLAIEGVPEATVTTSYLLPADDDDAPELKTVQQPTLDEIPF
jgi:hypothetical protein